jgi:hypothetical protein
MNIDTANSTQYKDSLKRMVNWMQDTCTKEKAYYTSPINLIQDANLVAVAVAIGMDNSVDHIAKRYLNALKYDKLRLPQLNAIANAAPSPHFSLLRCVIDRLSTELVEGERSPQDPEFLH